MWIYGQSFVYSWGKVTAETRKNKKHKNHHNMSIKITTTKMNDLKFESNLFNPMKTGRKVDEFFSGDNGLMPGTNVIVTGDPGVGKTTVLLDVLGDLNKAGKKCLFISGEMNAIDMVGYVKRFPKFGNLPVLFMGDYADECPMEVLETVLEDGYDLSLIHISEPTRPY